MTAPQVIVTVSDSPPPRSPAGSTDAWFLAGVTERGPLSATLARSIGDFESKFGGRTPEGMVTWDCADVFFREGGKRLFVSRVTGPDADAAFAVFDDVATAPTIRVEAISPGSWGNDLNVEFVDGDVANTLRIIVTYNGNQVEISGNLPDKAALVGYNSNYINIIDEDDAAGMPVEADSNLSGGDSDLVNAGDADYNGAIDRFESELGPGQISIAGGNPPDAVTAHLINHAGTRNRVALIDAPNDTASAIVAWANSTKLANPDSKFAGAFTPPATVPGVVPGTTRTVQYTAVQAGMTARIGSPGIPVAGKRGTASYAISAPVEYDESQRSLLNEVGVNVARNIYGTLRTYGYRSLATEEGWLGLNSAKVVTAIKAESLFVGEEYSFAPIDGKGQNISAFGGALMGMLSRFYQDGDLFGETTEEAFVVEVGEGINTPETIAARELRAVIGLRVSPFAEMVYITIVKYPSTESIN